MDTVRFLTNTAEIKNIEKYNDIPFDKTINIDMDGCPVDSYFCGVRYQIIAKKEYHHSRSERFLRGFLGVVLVIISLFSILIVENSRDYVKKLIFEDRTIICIIMRISPYPNSDNSKDERGNFTPKGIFYKIKNTSYETIGYFLGSIHVWQPKWKSLSQQVMDALKKSTNAVFETKIDESGIGYCVDLKVFGKFKDKKRYFLSSIDEQKTRAINHLEVIKNHPNILVVGQELRSLKSKSISSWETGNVNAIPELLLRERSFYEEQGKENVFDSTFSDVNKKWFNEHLINLLETSSKLNKMFICVGFGHIYDYGKNNLGLKTLFENSGYTLYPVP